MSEATDPLIQECSACGALIDVSDVEPMALMHCPTCGGAMRVRRQFGNFELLEILGAGGMGAVYRAQDATLNRSVALKLLRREYSEHPEFIRQFEHEASVTALINHPNVVRVYSTGSDHGLFYIAMELVDKGSLDDLMSLQKKVGEPQVLEVGIQIAQGLRAAFQRGLIHRDVKPGNILFAQAHHSKIVDFGLASLIDSSGEVAGEIWGTPYYVAPEKLENPPTEDFRSDIYSLGATLFHALAGRPPYEAEDASMVALKHLKSQPVSLQSFAPDVSASTAYVINRTLAKEPDERYQSYDELIEHLEYARNQLLTATATAVSVPGRPRARAGVKPRIVLESRGQQRALSFITVLMLLAVAAGGWYVYKNRHDLFPEPQKTRSASSEAARKAAAEIKPRYETARLKLLNGNEPEAAAEMHKLMEMPQTPQPLLDWAALHAGLATVLAGKLDDSHADFEKLSKYGPFSSDPFDKEVSDFMTALGTRMLDDNPVTPEEAQKLNRETYQAIGLLVYGAKNWELGEFDNANALFRSFTEARVGEPDEWVADYKKIPVRYTEEYEKYRGFAERVRAITDADKAKEEMPKLKAELAALDLKGALLRKGKTSIRKAQTLIDDAEAEVRAAEMEMENTDEKALAEQKAKADPLAAQFKFREALAEVKSTPAISSKGKKDKQNLMKKYDWLISFKAQLTQDLGAHPYTGALARKAGLPVAGQIADADEKSILVKVQATTVPVAWTDASYEGLVTLARANLSPDLAADRLADRFWFLGNLAVLMGKPAEATPYFKQAVEKKPEYAAEWKLFPEVPGSPEIKEEKPAKKDDDK